jgi:hypothetical protein
VAEVGGLTPGKLSATLWLINNYNKGKCKMNMKQIFIIAAVFVCCSPNSKTEDNLIGNWKNSAVILATTVEPNDPTNTIIVWDTVYFTREIQINSNQIKINNSMEYKINPNFSTDTIVTLTYAKSNDTLNISLKSNSKGYYKYNITSDSLLITYLYGDTIKLDNLSPFISDKFKKE